jgi:hypothetical protein
MATASAIITQARLRYGDSDTAPVFLTTDRCLTWLDEWQNAFVEVLLPLRRTKSFTVAANQESFSLPSDYVILEVATVTQSLRHPLKYLIPTEFERQKTSGRMTGWPQYYTFRDDKLYIWPFFSIASKTTTVNDTTTATAASITLASTGNLRDYGRGIIGTQEEIEYTNKGSNYINGVTRGVGGTTASTHASGITLTQTDLEFHYPRRASALASTSTPDINPLYHQSGQNYLLYLAETARGNNQKGMQYYDLFQEDLRKAEYNVKKQQIQRPLRIADGDRSGGGMIGRWRHGDFG